jgi:hypothetical protein
MIAGFYNKICHKATSPATPKRVERYFWVTVLTAATDVCVALAAKRFPDLIKGLVR